MPGDYSRFTDDPKRRVSSLLLQQGKVVLDADFNEESLTAEERRRLGALDTFGPAVVSTMAPDNAGAFELAATTTGTPPAPDLSIGPGRMWVDGKLVQCFPNDGEDKTDKTTKDRAPSYLHQPFLPEPKKLTDVSFPAVAYLDVWTREVTWVEEPDLLDKALGGVDTSTRLVTIWQLKLLEKQRGEPDPTCADVLKPKPSGGRLTTKAVAPPGPDDPCLVSPTGGYRGIENRLYRVQIHQGGAAGAATFKWSRDNASLVSPVERIEVQGTTSVLTVARIGRDPVLRFDVDDRVELIDDRRELHGVPGEMARVESVDETTRTVTLDRALSALSPQDLAKWHARLIRWDQKQPPNTLDAGGLMTVTTGAAIPLEDGIEITFELALDSPGAPSSRLFHTGDHWVFAARTADGWVEPLTNAPPRGIVHSYVALAEVTKPAQGGFAIARDCRVPWPPKSEGKGECCCTVVVRPREDDIQAALDEVCRRGGGCVCLKAGEHTITAPLRLRCSGVSLVGESGATVVRSEGMTPLLVIEGGGRIERTLVEGIRFRLEGENFQGERVIVRASDARDLTLRELEVSAPGLEEGLAGILLIHVDETRVEHCRIGQVDIGLEVTEGSGRVDLRGNVLESRGAGEQEPTGRVAIWLQDAREPCRVEANRIAGFARGVVLSDRLSADLPAPDGDPRSEARGSWIGGNDIVLGPARTVDDITFRPIAIEVAADAARVDGNRIGLTADRAQGVLVIAASAVRVTANVLVFAGRDPDGAATDGIVVWSARDDASPVVVAGNVIRGLTFGVQSVSARHTRIDGNAIAVTRSGIVLVDSTGDLVTANNVQGGRHGIHLALARDACLHGNTLERNAEAAVLGEKLRGTVTLDGNRVRFAAFTDEPPTEQPRAAVDLAADDGDPECEIVLDDCLVEEWGRVEPDKIQHGGPVVGVRVRAPRAAVRHNRIGNQPLPGQEEGADIGREHRALVLLGFPSPDPEARRLPGKALVLGNQFRGTGASALVEIPEARFVLGNTVLRQGFGRVSFSDNDVEHRSRPDRPEGSATCLLQGQVLVVSDNQVKGEGEFASFNLFDVRRPIFIGNSMTGEPFGLGGIQPPLLEPERGNVW